MSCTELTDIEKLLEAIESMEINPKYDTKKLDSDANDGYLKTFRRRVGVLHNCALKVRFGERASKVLDQKLASIGTRTIFIDGRVGNDIVVVKSRGGWRPFKIYLPDPERAFGDAQTASFSSTYITELDYDDIKGHQVPNWERSLEQTKEELRWIGLAVREMIYFDKNPEGANLEESMYV